MDFLKKAQKKMKEMMDDDGDKNKQHNNPPDQNRDFGQSQTSYQQPQYGYGSPPPPPQGQQYSQPPPPQLPSGWIAQWDQNSNRYYFLEQATGRTQWEMPGFVPYQYGAPPYGGGHGNQGGYGYPEHKKSGHGGALAAGAGGLAVGAIGGTIITHKITEDSSDDERHNTTAVPAGNAYAAQAPPRLLDETASGSSVSSSDKEEIEERREELEEAQEEYNEAVDEGYDD